MYEDEDQATEELRVVVRIGDNKEHGSIEVLEQCKTILLVKTRNDELWNGAIQTAVQKLEGMKRPENKGDSTWKAE